MADLKKEQEREELHRAIWAIADELRGAVDGWDLRTMCWALCFNVTYPKTLMKRLKECFCTLKSLPREVNLKTALRVFLMTMMSTLTKTWCNCRKAQ